MVGVSPSMMKLLSLVYAQPRVDSTPIFLKTGRRQGLTRRENRFISDVKYDNILTIKILSKNIPDSIRAENRSMGMLSDYIG